MLSYSASRMTAGVGLFGTLSGFLANVFLSPSKKKKEAETAVAEANDSKAQLTEIRALMQAQKEASADFDAKLEAKLEAIEKLL